MPVRIKAGEKEWTTHAMLDDGATRTIISQRAADKLEAERRQQSTYLHTVEGVTPVGGGGWGRDHQLYFRERTHID